jgi:hypothetical protein
MPATFVEGDTSTRIFTLTEEGVPVNLTGYTLVVILKPKDGSGLPKRTYPAEVAYPDQGKVGYSAAGCALQADESPYKVRFRATSPSGVVTYFPFPAADVWQVIE